MYIMSLKNYILKKIKINKNWKSLTNQIKTIFLYSFKMGAISSFKCIKSGDLGRIELVEEQFCWKKLKNIIYENWRHFLSDEFFLKIIQE